MLPVQPVVAGIEVWYAKLWSWPMLSADVLAHQMLPEIGVAVVVVTQLLTPGCCMFRRWTAVCAPASAAWSARTPSSS
ncbi:unannotated protein [freshwater metagenome]|uniref:Unannotated protein n=1 Tax=freshwater metagenome TaxID=449393 RepID=A0A6J7DF08_9ZZZZ